MQSTSQYTPYCFSYQITIHRSHHAYPKTSNNSRSNFPSTPLPTASTNILFEDRRTQHRPSPKPSAEPPRANNQTSQHSRPQQQTHTSPRSTVFQQQQQQQPQNAHYPPVFEERTRFQQKPQLTMSGPSRTNPCTTQRTQNANTQHSNREEEPRACCCYCCCIDTEERKENRHG